MRYLIAIAVLCLGIGGGLLLYSLKFPVYKEADVPGRLSLELESLPREQRFKEWYSRLRAYGTPRKRLSDVGRGLMAFGGGLLGAGTFWFAYRRWSRLRNIWTFLAFWGALWVMRIPFSGWYYGVRYRRFDYPHGATPSQSG